MSSLFLVDTDDFATDKDTDNDDNVDDKKIDEERPQLPPAPLPHSEEHELSPSRCISCIVIRFNSNSKSISNSIFILISSHRCMKSLIILFDYSSSWLQSWCLMSNVWCLMSDVWCLLLVQSTILSTTHRHLKMIDTMCILMILLSLSIHKKLQRNCIPNVSIHPTTTETSTTTRLDAIIISIIIIIIHNDKLSPSLHFTSLHFTSLHLKQ